jgi:UDP-2,3-diacylglucosamine hydrolase
LSDLKLFIADLHLTDHQPEIYQRFKAFLDTKARKADALYILGDLFEYYLGDDTLSEVSQAVCEDLKILSTDYQTQCFFMPGNRDFLVAKDFAKNAKLTILKDPTPIQIKGQTIVLSHGDELCTDDVEYQKVRQQLRSKPWQEWFLSQSINERIEFAKQARLKSQQHTQSVSDEIMDVNQIAVEKLFQNYQANYLLHGHTHRPAFHINGDKQRMVVGDWHYQTSYIEYKNNHFQLVAY